MPRVADRTGGTDIFKFKDKINTLRQRYAEAQFALKLNARTSRSGAGSLMRRATSC